MTWAILGTIFALIAGVSVLPEVPSIIDNLTEAERNKTAAEKLHQQDESNESAEELVRAKDERNRAIWKSVIILSSVLSAVYAVYIIFVRKVFKKGKKTKKK